MLGDNALALDALLTGSAIVPALWHLEVQNVLLMFERRKRILRIGIRAVLPTLG